MFQSLFCLTDSSSQLCLLPHPRRGHLQVLPVQFCHWRIYVSDFNFDRLLITAWIRQNFALPDFRDEIILVSKFCISGAPFNGLYRLTKLFACHPSRQLSLNYIQLVFGDEPLSSGSAWDFVSKSFLFKRLNTSSSSVSNFMFGDGICNIYVSTISSLEEGCLTVSWSLHGYTPELLHCQVLHQYDCQVLHQYDFWSSFERLYILITQLSACQASRQFSLQGFVDVNHSPEAQFEIFSKIFFVNRLNISALPSRISNSATTVPTSTCAVFSLEEFSFTFVWTVTCQFAVWIRQKFCIFRFYRSWLFEFCFRLASISWRNRNRKFKKWIICYFFNLLFLSDEGPMLETLDYSLYHPYWQHTDLFIFRFVTMYESWWEMRNRDEKTWRRLWNCFCLILSSSCILKVLLIYIFLYKTSANRPFFMLLVVNDILLLLNWWIYDYK